MDGNNRFFAMSDKLNSMELKDIDKKDIKARNKDKENLILDVLSMKRIENNSTVTTLDDANTSNFQPTIKQINCLTVLQLVNNNITRLPESIADLRCLETFVLRSNKLVELPDSCLAMKRLKQLDLSKNLFTRIPECIVRGMENLEVLNLSYNLRIDLTSAPASKKLTNFCAAEAQRCSKFPNWLLTGGAGALKHLNLDGTSFEPSDFPNDCKSMGIKNLSLRRCSITEPFVEKFTSYTNELVSINIGNGNNNSGKNKNIFWTIPMKNLKHPEYVTDINLRSTTMVTISSDIKHFVNLVKLDIGRNSIHCLPNYLCKLRKLKILIIEENQLFELPDAIYLMHDLEELKANKNYLVRLPKTFKKLKKLAYLDLYENELGDVSQDLCIENLLGLDIEQNIFDTNDLSNKHFELVYEKLRETLRKRYFNQNVVREIGRKVYDYNTDERSNNSSINNHHWNHTEIPNENVTTIIEEERWDLSDDSSDEFDPTGDYIQSKKKQLPFSLRTRIAEQSQFCPGNLHPTLIKQQLMELRKKGLCLKYSYEQIEGQFEDV